GGLDIAGGEITIPTPAVVWSFVTGLLVTVVAAVAPALRASRIPPVAAMRDATVDQSSASKLRILSGLLVSLLGIVMLVLGLFGDSGLIFVGLGMAVVFLGVAILRPLIPPPTTSAPCPPL